MTVKKRLLALKLLEQLQNDPEYAEYLGIRVELQKKLAEEEENV